MMWRPRLVQGGWMLSGSREPFTAAPESNSVRNGGVSMRRGWSLALLATGVRLTYSGDRSSPIKGSRFSKRSAPLKVIQQLIGLATSEMAMQHAHLAPAAQ